MIKGRTERVTKLYAVSIAASRSYAELELVSAFG
jgi:hypothetical protein